jgi:hypothetical protein
LEQEFLVPQWIALSPGQHAGQRFLPRDGYHFAAQLNVAGLLLAELPKLLPHYVLVFIKEGRHFLPMVLLGVGQKNLYVAPNGKWLGSYVPASLRGYPFVLATNELGEKFFALDASQLNESLGDFLFDEDGKLAGTAAQSLEFLTQCERNRYVTQQAADALQRAGVIEPWALTIDQGEGQKPLSVNGVWRINEQVLNNLDSDVYGTLKGAPMALAHAQMFSVSQQGQLTERARSRSKHAQSSAALEDLEGLFGDDDAFQFGFDD